MTRLRFAVAVLAFTACPRGPLPPTGRAKECNEFCARYLAEGNLQSADEQCNLGIEFSPQFGDLWVNKGLIALARGDQKSAREFFIKALRLNNDQAQAHNNLGAIYLNEREFHKAHDNFQHALRVDPDYLEARLNLGFAFKGMGERDSARAAWRTLLHVKPTVAEAWGQLGAMELEDGHVDDAIENLTKAVQLDPQFFEAWLTLGNAYMEAGKPCDAKDSFTACLEVREDTPECRNNVVIAEKKCQLQLTALAAGEKTAAGQYSLALEAREKGQSSQEERALNRCLTYDPKYALCHSGLFELFRRRGDEKRAAVACMNVLTYANEREFASQVATCRQYVNE